MEREELESKISEKLGSTQLSLTKETLDMFYEDTIKDITDDSKVDDEFVERKVKYLKTLEGQLHSDVSRQVKIYKEDWEKKNKKTDPKDGDDHSSRKNNDNDNDEIRKLREELEDIKKSNAKEKESRQKASILNEVEKGLKSKLSKAGIEVNNYILKQTKKELDITIDKDGNTPDVDELVSKAEKNYFKSLKEAGLESNTHPGGGSKTGGKGTKSIVDSYFMRKQQKEHWGKAKK